MSADEMREIYELARQHGLSHDAALHCVEMGEVRCWCGSDRPCFHGAFRHIGCAIRITKSTEAA